MTETMIMIFAGAALVSAGIGFFFGWWIFKSDSVTRNEVMEQEILRLRRRLSRAENEARAATRDRDTFRSRWRQDQWSGYVDRRIEPLRAPGVPAQRGSMQQGARESAAPDPERVDGAVGSTEPALSVTGPSHSAP